MNERSQPRRLSGLEINTLSGFYSRELPKTKWNSKNPYFNPSNKEDSFFTQDAKELAEELVQLLTRKQSDYGPHSISRTPGGAINGIIVRMHDKISRLVNLVFNKKTNNNESIIDTLLDIAGYAFLAILFLRGKWDKYEKNSRYL